MRKWLQPHGGRREDRDGSEMVPRKKRRRKRIGERERIGNRQNPRQTDGGVRKLKEREQEISQRNRM